MESVLGADIIITPKEACQKYQKIHYVVLKVYAKTNLPSSENIQVYEENATMNEDTYYSKTA